MSRARNAAARAGTRALAMGNQGSNSPHYGTRELPSRETPPIRSLNIVIVSERSPSEHGAHVSVRAPWRWERRRKERAERTEARRPARRGGAR